MVLVRGGDEDVNVEAAGAREVCKRGEEEVPEGCYRHLADFRTTMLSCAARRGCRCRLSVRRTQDMSKDAEGWGRGMSGGREKRWAGGEACS